MLINISSSNASFFSPNSSINIFFGVDCFIYKSNLIIFSTFNVTNIVLLLPLCIFILHHGFQQWRQSSSSFSSAISHSDSFTYHLVTMEIFGVVGCFLNFLAIFTDQPVMLIVGIFLLAFTYFGEILFHIVTCVERYLAVIHPVTYLSLRKERGIRIRNVCIGCVWLLSVLLLSLLQDGGEYLIVLNFFILILSLITVSFCSVSVFCILIRPDSREQSGGGGRQSKQRAFYTVAVILGMLVFRFVWELIRATLNVLEQSFNCEMMLWTFWLCMPSRLVLPLLFLFTKEKLKEECLFCSCCIN